ncbi:FAD-binding protein [Rhodovulum sp. YNF3179]|uniref:FAD-binding oxidoreductase n=1 Tax=Rhodovulum sp. YNF3179 TaxID=3425127 RepID=UPI003D324CBE
MRWNRAETTGWGRALRAAEEIARPENRATLHRLMTETPAPAMGNRRSYGDAALNHGGRSIDMTRLDRLIGFDPETGILEAEAGATIGEIARVFAPRGWLPAVMPGTGFATLGGAIANDVHGKNHHVAGSFGQHVVAIDLLTPAGRRTLTADSDARLWRATIGGVGQTGVILSARIRLIPCPSTTMRVRERRIETLDEFLGHFEDSDAPYSVGWIDATARGAALGRGIFEEGRIAPHDAGHAPGAARRVPLDAPRALLSGPVVRAFNAVYWRRVPAGGRSVARPLERFFFPLDRLHDWNRLYGKPGFHQFQCVVPPAATDTLREMLDRIGTAGLASPLAVLKRMGPGRAGHLSFPMEGWTLAVDFPNRAPARALIAGLEGLARDAGGRLYLAKDALAAPERLAGMYPDLPDFAAAAAEVDPAGHFATDLVRRLRLREAT